MYMSVLDKSEIIAFVNDPLSFFKQTISDVTPNLPFDTIKQYNTIVLMDNSRNYVYAQPSINGSDIVFLSINGMCYHCGNNNVKETLLNAARALDLYSLLDILEPEVEINQEEFEHMFEEFLATL